MKGFLALLIMALIALTGMNMWQIQQLRGEVHALRRQLAEQRHSTDALAQAIEAVRLARDAVKSVDTPSARRAVDTARQKLSEAAAVATEKARHTLKWLEEQMKHLAQETKGNNGASR